MMGKKVTLTVDTGTKLFQEEKKRLLVSSFFSRLFWGVGGGVVLRKLDSFFSFPHLLLAATKENLKR